jgi:pantetheine-phosphate adenylyltransferase
MKKFSHTIVGGTFDRFHAGHQKLLDTVFAASDFVTIGISTEKLYKNKLLANIIESFETRKKYVQTFVNNNNVEDRVNIIAIDDIYGTTLQEKNIDAIFVTEKNKEAAGLINEKRKVIGFPPLHIVLVPFVKGNDGKVISSDRIRKGEIDRAGNSYQLLFSETSLTLPHSLRSKLREPIGKVVQDLRDVISGSSHPVVIAVGDIVALTFFANDQQANVSIVDFKTRRHVLHGSDEISLNALQPTISAKNSAGKIEKEAVKRLNQAIATFLETGEKQTIKIDGEEDLLTLPAILLSPLGSVVVYGQFDRGAVIVTVTEEKKQDITALVKQFEACYS